MAEDDKNDPQEFDCPFHGEDTLLPGPTMPDGSIIAVRHSADHQMAIGALVPNKPGQYIPDSAHLVTEEDGKFTVGPSIAELKAGGRNRSSSGAVTPSYRRNYEGTFGKPKVGLA